MLQASISLAGEHGWSQIGLAGLVLLVASFAVVALLRRSNAVRGLARRAWLAGAAVAASCAAVADYLMLIADPAAASTRILAIAGVTLAVFGASILAALIDRRRAERNVLFNAVLNNMSHGLITFDAAGRVVLCNQRYLDLYNIPPGTVRPGLPLRELLQHRLVVGSPIADPDRYVEDVLAEVARGATSRRECTLENGRIIAMVSEPMPQGGWVAIHHDITEERQRETSFRFLFDNNPLPMWVWDHATFRYLAVNNAALEKYGYDRAHFLTLTVRDIKRTSDWTHLDAIASSDENTLEQGVTSVHARADGTLFDIEIYGRSIIYAGRAASLVAGVDITERKRSEAELRSTRKFLDTIIENMPAILTVKDTRDMRYALVNRAAEECVGMKRADIIGKRASEIFAAQSASAVEAADMSVIASGALQVSDEHELETVANGIRLMSTKKLVVPGQDGDAQYILSLSEDVTDRKRAREQIAHMARHDTLTDLPNRAAFNEKLAATLEHAAATMKPFAVISIDIDRFKEANDVFGHAAGDALLHEIAQRLDEAAGEEFLARLGGDEFALIVTEGAQPSRAEMIAEWLLKSMSAVFTAGDQSMHVGLSIGVAVYPSDGADATALLANANAALYRAKTGGRGTVRFFEAQMDDRVRERRALQHELRAAIENNELVLHYQPQARIGGEIIGFEALVAGITRSAASSRPTCSSRSRRKAA